MWCEDDVSFCRVADWGLPRRCALRGPSAPHTFVIIHQGPAPEGGCLSPLSSLSCARTSADVLLLPFPPTTAYSALPPVGSPELSLDCQPNSLPSWKAFWIFSSPFATPAYIPGGLGLPEQFRLGKSSGQCLWGGCLCIRTCQQSLYQSNLSVACKSLEVWKSLYGFQRNTAGSENHPHPRSGKEFTPIQENKTLSSQTEESVTKIWNSNIYIFRYTELTSWRKS